MAEAKDLMHDLATDLDNIQRPLAALEGLDVADEEAFPAAIGDLKNTGIAEAVNSCGSACETFSKNLQKWTKHSAAKSSFRDRFLVGVWNKEKFATFRTRVQSCQATVQLAVASAQLIVQLRSLKISESDRENIKQQLGSLETSVKEQLDRAKQQQVEARQSIYRLQEEPDDEEDDGAQRTLATMEVEERSRLLEADQVSCGVIFAQVRSNRTEQQIGNVLTSDDSYAVVGMPESVVGKIIQRIGNVTTEKGSASVVGVYQGDINMKDMFSSRR